MRMSDWSSDVCSSDLSFARRPRRSGVQDGRTPPTTPCDARPTRCDDTPKVSACLAVSTASLKASVAVVPGAMVARRSEEHTSELQSLMRISYAVFCLKKKKHKRS